MITCPSDDDSVQVFNDIQDELLQQPWPAAILDTTDACVKFDDKNVAFKGLRVRIGVEIGKPEVVYDEVSKGYDYYGDVPNGRARGSDRLRWSLSLALGVSLRTFFTASKLFKVKSSRANISSAPSHVKNNSRSGGG